MEIKIGTKLANPTIRDAEQGWIYSERVVTEIFDTMYKLARKNSKYGGARYHKSHVKESFNIDDYLGRNGGVFNHYPIDQIDDIIEQLNYHIPRGRLRKKCDD